MVLNEQASAKWQPILEHESLPKIDDSYRKSVTAVLLENQEKMMREQASQRTGSGLFLTEDPLGSGMDMSNYPGGDGLNTLPNAGPYSTGQVQYVDPVLISLVRRTMPKLLAYDVCGVQPLTGPTGLIFAMRSHYQDGVAVTPGTPGRVENEALFREAKSDWSNGGTGPDATAAGMGDHTKGGTHAPYSGGADPTDIFFNPASNVNDVSGFGISTSQGEAMNTGGGNAPMNEMSFSIEKMTVSAQTRKLRGQYTLEMAQDLKVTHGLNAESELANILSNEILAEVNRQVIRTIYAVAKPGCQNTTNPEFFDLLTDSNGRWSVEKFKGLMFQLEVEANQIARETRRGKGNVIICSADVCSALNMAGMLDYSSNMKVALKNDETTDLFAGLLNGQFKVYIDPYLPMNAQNAMVTVGYKGTSPYDSGVFYCPYQPLQMLKAQDPATFTPIIGFMSRDAMVANPFSQLDNDGTPMRLAGNGIEMNKNVYYRKFRVANLN
jgi:hypothetical protein